MTQHDNDSDYTSESTVDCLNRIKSEVLTKTLQRDLRDFQSRYPRNADELKLFCRRVPSKFLITVVQVSSSYRKCLTEVVVDYKSRLYELIN